MQPFHSMVSPPQGGALHVPIPPGHVIVHIPPVVRPTVPPSVVVSTEGELASFVFLPIASFQPFYESLFRLLVLVLFQPSQSQMSQQCIKYFEIIRNPRGKNNFVAFTPLTTTSLVNNDHEKEKVSWMPIQVN